MEYQWKIIGNTVRQITVPEYLVPNDNTYGTLHGPDRNHPEFASSVYAEQQKAQETLAEILGQCHNHKNHYQSMAGQYTLMQLAQILEAVTHSSFY